MSCDDDFEHWYVTTGAYIRPDSKMCRAAWDKALTIAIERVENTGETGRGSIAHVILKDLLSKPPTPLQAENMKLMARSFEDTGWISVEDRLPEDSSLVIVEGGVARYKSRYGMWITETGSDAGREIQWKVTHWMPLPKPPTPPT